MLHIFTGKIVQISLFSVIIPRMRQEIENQPNQLIKEVRAHFIKTLEEGEPIYRFFPEHVSKVQEWTLLILPHFPKADKEIVLLSVWFHDIGHADGKVDEDHAIKSEAETIKFLEARGYPKEKIDQVAHCVRAHRCKDIPPETIEAKILVAADSASHMTDHVYLDMMGQERLSRQDVLDKLKRDYRDKIFLPEELQPKIDLLYQRWKGLLEVFPKS